jgi:hypothetical protein
VAKIRALLCVCALALIPPEIAKRTQFLSQHPVFKTLTTKKFPFFSKANLIEGKATTKRTAAQASEAF